MMRYVGWIVLFSTTMSFAVETRFEFRPSTKRAAEGVGALAAGRTDGLVVIDGAIDAKEWANAGRTAFVPSGDSPQTFIYAMHDDVNLYFAFDCREEDVARIRALYSPDGVGQFGPQKSGDVLAFEDDAIEIFLFPEGPDERYQFIANTIGGKYDGIIRGDRDDDMWKGDWETKAKVGADRWTIEFRIAIKSVAPEGRLGRQASVAFMRDRMASGMRQVLYWQDEPTSSWTGARWLIAANDPAAALKSPLANRPRSAKKTEALTAYLEKFRYDLADGAASVFFDIAQPALGMRVASRWIDPVEEPIAKAVVGENHGELVINLDPTWPAGTRTLEVNLLKSSIAGRVTSVKALGEDIYVSVNAGKNIGIDENMKLFVHRGSAFLGNLVILKVAADEAAGKMVLLKPGADIVAGDSVISGEGEVISTSGRLTFELTGKKQTATSGQVALTMDIPEQARGLNELCPVTMGVPWPKGALASAEAVCLYDHEGKPVAVQTAAVQWWDRHRTSVQWLHLDFLAPAGSHGKTWTLRYGEGQSSLRPASSIVVIHEGNLISIDAKAIRFAVRSDRFGFIDELWRGEEQLIFPGAGNDLTIMDREGNTFRGAGDEQVKVTVEQAGPLHAIVRAEGWHVRDKRLPGDVARKVRYVVRLHAYAGLPRVGVEHTFIMTEGYEEAFPEVAMGMRLWPAEKRTLSAGHNKGVVQMDAPARQCVAVLQPDWFGFRAGLYNPSAGTWGKLFTDSDPKAWGKGWIAVRDRARSILVSGQDWRENYVKGYELNDRVLKIQVWPAQAGKPLSFHPRDYLAPALVNELSGSTKGTYFDSYTYKDALVVSPPIGAGKTHVFTLDFGGGDDVRAEAAAATTNEPATAIVPPAWYQQSEVFGRFSVRDPQRFPDVEKAFDAMWDQFTFRQHEARDYGLIGFGNNKHQFMNRDPGNWAVYRMYAGMGYGLLNQPWLLYVRSGERRFLTDAKRTSRHAADFNICHYGPRRGAHSSLSCLHWAYNMPEIGLHLETQFLLRDWWMTGNRRALDVLRDDLLIAANNSRARPGPVTDRAYFDPQKNLIDFYRLTWDERYLREQQLFFDSVAMAYDTWQPQYGHYAVKMLAAVHAFNGDPRALELAVKLLDSDLAKAGYGTGGRECLASYIYQVTGNPHWIESQGGEAKMVATSGRIRTEEPLPVRGVLYDENPNKPGDFYPETFICMWMDKIWWKYTYFMQAIVDAGEKINQDIQGEAAK